MTKTICFSLVSHYLDLGARIFSTQWVLYDAHILQGLIYVDPWFICAIYVKGGKCHQVMSDIPLVLAVQFWSSLHRLYDYIPLNTWTPHAPIL